MMAKPIRALELHYISNDSVINFSVVEGFTLIRCHSFMVHGGVLYVVVQFYSWFKFYFP